ncbi:S1 RNA-binding domain-containing protein [Streptomyces sp. NPDC086554]|uniref:S1 RNA-binding domain-containing protein n=1 Tax=Streptomyces sp. NPDC086554 TaxID=3154864 RepID=UPI00344613DD
MPEQNTSNPVKAGDVRKGVVSAVEEFGVLVDMGDCEGLIDRLEVSWKRGVDASQTVRVGQELAVLVLGVDQRRGRIALSLKGLEPDPMQEFGRKSLGTTISGRVTEINRIGTFVQLDDDLVGLLFGQPEKQMKIGDEVSVTVRGVNLHTRQIRLSLANAD